MHLLHLTTEFPWPAISGGSVRTVSQLRILASLPEVETLTVLSVAEQPVSEVERQAFEAAIPKLRVLPPVFHPVHLFDFKRYVPRVVALRALRGLPYLVGKWESQAVRAALRRQLAAGPVDAVYIDHLGMTRYLADIRAIAPKCRVVLDEHNVESDFFKQFAAAQGGLKKIVADAEYRVSHRYEQDALRAVDAVVAISHEDARMFTGVAGVDAQVVPMVLPFVRVERPRPGATHFCYVGNLRWRPNVAGLDWLCGTVWPMIRAIVPDATLEIAGVGLKPDADGVLPVPAAWRVDGVTTVGFVEDLEPLYRRSLAMLAPVFGGSGVRVKMLEGFRAGMPVVTTPDGAFGLPLADGRETLVSGDAQGFAERVARLATDDTLRLRLRDGGYDYLERHHSLASAQAAMREALRIG